MAKKEYITFDVMCEERFITTMHYEHYKLFKLDLKALYRYITDRLPTLKNKAFSICFDDDTEIKFDKSYFKI